MVKEALETLLARAKEAWETMTETQRRDMLDEQRRSWARGEAGMGSDRDEAEYVKALVERDVERLKQLDREAAERAARLQ
jgi:hypothetical protein